MLLKLSEEEIDCVEDFEYLSDSDYKQLGFSVSLKLKCKHFLKERKAKMSRTNDQ